MLTDTKLKNLKPLAKSYKVADRDGLYVAVLPTGTISFRYNYRLNGRQETIVLGQYGPHALSLKEAREKLALAKKSLQNGSSPARQKARQRTRQASAETFGEWASRWLEKHKMAESMRDMRRSVYERDLAKAFSGLKMWEITHEDLRSLCDKIVDRGAPATAVHAREIVLMVYRYLLKQIANRFRSGGQSGRTGFNTVDLLGCLLMLLLANRFVAPPVGPLFLGARTMVSFTLIG